jgi:hypothetical protein
MRSVTLGGNVLLFRGHARIFNYITGLSSWIILCEKLYLYIVQ